jgi:hypothetical protein
MALRLQRAVLGTTLVAGLGLLGTGAAGVLALDNDVRAAERPVRPRLVRQQTHPAGPCPGHSRPAPQRAPARQQV